MAISQTIFSQSGGLSLQKPSAPLDKSDIPPGGKKEVKTEVSIVGNKKTTKVTTTITDPSGGKTTRVETKVETTS